MKSKAGVVIRIPFYQIFRWLGVPKMLPVNLTITPSVRCNSHCKTCNIWKKDEKELSLDEWEKIFVSFKKVPYWVTISGGEPFLYKDLVALCELIYKQLNPGIINIPSNGILSQIPEKTKLILQRCPGANLVINLSLDGVGEKHDAIRGIPRNFELFERTLRELLLLKDEFPNLSIGVHTVISKFNLNDFDEILAYLSDKNINQYIMEIAEQRVELDTIGMDITPSPDEYRDVVKKYNKFVKQRFDKGISRISQAFRNRYNQLVPQIFEQKRQVIPCYSGWASTQIYCDGTIWPCCIRADDLGNLSTVDYDFKKIWFGEKIKDVRKSIKARECYCPLANASYTNILFHYPSLIRSLYYFLFR